MNISANFWERNHWLCSSNVCKFFMTLHKKNHDNSYLLWLRSGFWSSSTIWKHENWSEVQKMKSLKPRSQDANFNWYIHLYAIVWPRCVLQFVHASCHSAVSKFHFIKHLTHLHAHIPTNIQQVTQLSNCPNIFFLSARNICCLTTLMRDPLW